VTSGGGVVTFLEKRQFEMVDRRDIDEPVPEEGPFSIESEVLQCLLCLFVPGQCRIAKIRE
jgi:hypothetical protein